MSALGVVKTEKEMAINHVHKVGDKVTVKGVVCIVTAVTKKNIVTQTGVHRVVWPIDEVEAGISGSSKNKA